MAIVSLRAERRSREGGCQVGQREVGAARSAAMRTVRRCAHRQSAQVDAPQRPPGAGVSPEEGHMTELQRVAICFAAGVPGAVAVVAFSHILFALGVSQQLGVKAPIPLKSPDIYRPLFWGGLWGIPFGLLIEMAWPQLYLFGSLYFLAPVAALFLFFLPASGAGYFGLKQGPLFAVYLLLVNLPFGIVMALAAKAIIGEWP
jgi:hypothetical protein